GVPDRSPGLLSRGRVAVAPGLCLVPSVPGWGGDPATRALAVVSVPVAIILLVVYVGATWYSLRRHSALHTSSDDEVAGWSLPRSLVALGLATVATALVAEVLVGSLEAFAKKAGLSDFFVAAVIVAIVGHAAE